MELIRQITRLAESDPWHRRCLEELRRTEPDFLAIRQTLTEAQQEKLDAYISACEELEHSKIYIAFNLGKHKIIEE